MVRPGLARVQRILWPDEGSLVKSPLARGEFIAEDYSGNWVSGTKLELSL